MSLIRFSVSLMVPALIAGYIDLAIAEDVPQVCYRAVELQRQKDWSASIDTHTECLNSGLLNSQDLASAYNNRGLAHAALVFVEMSAADRLGDDAALSHLEMAIEDLDRAVEINPNDAFAYCVRGTAKLEIGWWFEDEEYLEEGEDDIQKGRDLGETDEFWCDQNRLQK